MLVALVAASASASTPVEFEFVKTFGPDGNSGSDFGELGPAAFDQGNDFLYVLERNEGTLHKFDSEGNPVDFDGSVSYISENRITGLVPPPQIGTIQVAVDSTSHEIYVTSNNTVEAFDADGEPADFTAGPFAGSNAIGGFGKLAGIAVDSEGFIYASDNEAGVVRIFEPSGQQINEFVAPNAANLAVDSTGVVYVNQWSSSVIKFTPSSPLPVGADTMYLAASEPIVSDQSFTVAVDPATDWLYVALFIPSEIRVFSETGAYLASFAQSGSNHEVELPYGLAVDADDTTVYIAGGSQPGLGVLSQVHIFRRIPPPPPSAPAIKYLAVADAGSGSATLQAFINPNQVFTTYHFEYGLGDCATSSCLTAPPSDAAIGAGDEPVLVSQKITGLQPETTYHYRVVAKNALGTTASIDRTFTTQTGGLGFNLIDRRAWEMVSPPDKHGALVLSGFINGHVQAAADGNGLAYATLGSVVADPTGSRSLEASSPLARREGEGWLSQDLTSPNSRTAPLLLARGEYTLFNPDLSEALLEPRDGTNLSPEASERSPYLRQNTDPPLYRPLVTAKEGFANVPPGTEFGNEDPKTGVQTSLSFVTVQAASPDLEHVVLRSIVPLGPGTPEFGMYHWFEGQLTPVSVLPDAEGGEMVGGQAGSGILSVRHAISDDGSRVFWSAPQSSPRGLYVRDTRSEATVRLDVPESGVSGGEGEVLFQGASADGSVVFFTDRVRLTQDASSEGADLYRCELPPSGPLTGCAELEDLSAPLAGSEEPSEVQGLLPGFGEDGNTAYFVAMGKLDPGPNQGGDVAAADAPNLYVWHQGAGVRYIATLSSEDSADWGLVRTILSAERLSPVSSPNGRYLTFMSERSLYGEDNLGTASLQPVERVFLFDQQNETLVCVSCDPTGASPEDPETSPGGQEQQLIDSEKALIDPYGQWEGTALGAMVPPATRTELVGISLYRTRVVQDDGRVFFNARDSLVSTDSNHTWDVYQYEPIGVGTCGTSPADAGNSHIAGGCLSLLSSGTANEPSIFLDASASGDDVFFLTPAKLSVTDHDDEADVYDARVDGVTATLAPSTECLGEACQPAAVAPDDATPGTATLHGSGNVKAQRPRHCPKGKRRIRRHGHLRCVPRHHREAHRHRAGSGRRAGR